MRKAALLIDWENVRAGLTQESYGHPSKEIGQALVQLARKRAEDAGAVLEFKAFFAPPRTVLVKTEQDLRDVGLEFVKTMSGSQAADAALSNRALALAYQEYGLFFLVANDAGFIATATELENLHHNVEIWAVSPKLVKQEVREWHGTHYLKEILNLRPTATPTPNDLELLALACHQLVAKERALWGYHQSIEELARTGVLGGTERVAQVWAQADAKGFFRTDPSVVRGQNRNARRLAYENRDLARLFTICDSALWEIGQRREGCSRADALRAIEHPEMSEPQDVLRTLDMLIKTGYLEEATGQDVRLPSEGTKFGTVHALRRIALIAWGQPYWLGRAGAGDRKLNSWEIANRWPAHVVPGAFKRLPEPRLKALRQEGKNLVRRGHVAGVLVRYDADGPPKFELREGHPVAKSVKATLKSLVGLMSRLGPPGQELSQDQVLKEMNDADPPAGGEPPYGWKEGDCRAALSMAAAERHVFWRSRENAVQLNLGSPLVQAMIDEQGGV